ncbi:MAG: hypothetical protein JST05_09190 [Acidobacteria bacterium]|nr:hypothetical protein [Acidobacteriota bacterium]
MALARVRRRLPGLAVWAAALLGAWLLPGHLWHSEQPPDFPFPAILPTLGAFLLLIVLAPITVLFAGPRLARSRSLSALEAPPDFIWGLLLLTLWPASAGPPGWGAWMLALLLSALPGEARWLAASLPPEAPFPSAWGPRAARAWRLGALRRLVPRWIAARLPLWITASLILERILGLPGLGSDWSARVSIRDHAGLTIWIAGFALLWLLARPLERETS